MPLPNQADDFPPPRPQDAPERRIKQAPVDHADEFENITAWWWNPDAAPREDLSLTLHEEAEAELAALLERQIDSVRWRFEASRAEGRWAGQSLGVHRRLVIGARKEILAGQGRISIFAGNETVEKMRAEMDDGQRESFDQQVNRIVEVGLDDIMACLPQLPPAAEWQAGDEHQKKLVFAAPGLKAADKFTASNTVYDRLRIVQVLPAVPTSLEDKLFLRHYNELLQTAYEDTLREFGLNPLGQNDEGLLRRLEVKDDEVNIYEVCRTTYAKMDARPETAALALVLGPALT